MAGTMQPELRPHWLHKWVLAEFSLIDMSCLSLCPEIFLKRCTVCHSSASIYCIVPQPLRSSLGLQLWFPMAPFLLQSMALYITVRSRGCLEISSTRRCQGMCPADQLSAGCCYLSLVWSIGPCILRKVWKKKQWTSHHFADEGRVFSFKIC